MRSKKTWLLILGLTMAVWATFHPVSKLLLQNLSPVTVSFFRLVFALFFFLPYLWLRGGFAWPDRADWKNIAINAGAGSFGAALLINTGLQHTTAAASAVLVNTTPLFVALIAVLKFQQEFTKTQTAGLVFAFAGMALVATNGELAWITRPEFLSGNLLSLTAALAIAIATFAAVPLAKKFGAVQGQFFGIAPAVVGFFITWLAAGEYNALDRITPVHWAGLFWIGFVVSGVCWSVTLEAMRRFGPVLPSSFKTLIPLFAVLYSAVFLGEALSPLFAIGMASAIAGLYLVGQTKTKQEALGRPG